MAIYHQHIKVFSRAKGHNLVKAIAYRRGVKLIDIVTGNIYDFSRKKNVIHSEIMVHKNAPQWIKDLIELEKTDRVKAAEMLANSIELGEKRKDAQLAREVEFALPIELTKEQNLDLCRDFISFFTEQGMVAEFNIHWEEGNPHAHIILSMRELIESGWGKKITAWNNKEVLNKSREVLAEKLNTHFAMAGIEFKVSHLSNCELGIDQEATVHVGNRKNTNQQARERNEAIHAVNLKKIIENPKIILDKLSAQKSTFNLQDVAKALNPQLNLATYEDYKIEVGSVVDFDGTSAPNLKTIVPQQLESPIHLKEVPIEKIKIKPNSSPQEIVERVLTEIASNESVFTERYLTVTLARYLKNPEEIAKVLLQFKSSPQLISIGFGEDGRERYTTCDLFNIESELQNLAAALGATAKHRVANGIINKSLKKFNLKDDQAKAIKYILQGKDLSCMVGRSGTGKSYSLQAALWAWKQAGFNVQGIALAGAAAQNLEQDSGIKSNTIESFICALNSKKLILSNKDVIVMDEAGMTDSISMSKVILAVFQAKAKLVLVGDHAQLQPVGPGAIFRALIELLGFTELITIRRQKEEWQRKATTYFASGDTKKGLEYYQEHNHIHLSETLTVTLENLINDWGQSVKGSSLANHLILAYLNADVEQLNKLAREKIVELGGLAQNYLVQSEQKILQIAVGERIIFLENSWRYQVKNGQRGTIINIEVNAINKVKTITVLLDGKQKKVVSFDPNEYKKFNYGYACTVHRAQGATVENSFVLANGRWCKNLTYVAMTRHRNSADVYASQENYKNIEELKDGLSKHRIKDSILDYPEAFAERRGIDPQAYSNVILFQKHIVNKLKKIKQTIANAYEKLVDPDTYWKNVAAQNKTIEILKRREDAKLVAAYVDANCQTGKAWAEFKASNDNIEYQKFLYQAQILRNSLAAKISEKPEKYTLALEIHNLKLKNLWQQAKKHELYTKVREYIEQLKSSNMLRDKKAYEIEHNIKAYYHYLKKENVNLKELTEQALAHRTRIFLLNLSRQERKAFKLVESYLNLVKQSAELWSKNRNSVGQHKIDSNLISGEVERSSIKNWILKKGIEVNQERDRLASLIKKDEALYREALNYFEFEVGSLTNIHLAGPKELSLVVLPEGSQNLYNAVALSLTQEVAALKIKVAIQLENNIDQYRSFIKLLPNRTIEDYIQDLKESKDNVEDLDLNILSKILNRAIIGIGEDLKIINQQTLKEKYTGEPILVYCDKANNYSGVDGAIDISGLIDNLQREVWRNQKKVDRTRRLEKHAKGYEYRLQVQEYINKSKVSMILRDQKAHEIETDLKAHYTYLKSENISIKELIEQALAHRKRMFLLKLSIEQRQAFRLVERYNQLTKQAAKLWAKNRTGTISEWVINKALVFNQERDSLAYTIKQNLILYADALNYFGIGEINNTIREAKFKLLENRALEFERKKILQEKLLKFKQNVGNLKERCVIAKEIVAAPKYYQLANTANVNIPNLWKYAKYQEKIELLNELNPMEYKFYLTVNNYRQLRRQAGKLWSEIFTQKKEGLDIESKVLRDAIQLNIKRDELAYNIERSLETYNKFLLDLPIQDLKKHAKSHEKLLDLQQVEFANDRRFSTRKPNILAAKFNNLLERIYLKSEEFSSKQIEKQQYAKQIVKNSIPIAGTIAEKYLREHRGLAGDVSDQSFVFNPLVKEPETQQEWPALVVIARNKKKEVQAVQCVYLDPVTAKQLEITVSKRSYGPQENTEILVQQAKYVSNAYDKCVLVCGPETALSIAEADRDLGVYLTLGVNFVNVPISTRCIEILLCGDQHGLDTLLNRNLDHAIKTLSERGLNVYLARPNDVKDFNEVIKKHGVIEAKRLLDDKKLVKKALILEELIDHKDRLVSDHAKVMVDFLVKYQKHKNLKEPKSLEEVNHRQGLFKQLGQIALFIKGNGVFEEICKRHNVIDKVIDIEKQYFKAQKMELEVAKLLDTLNSKDPIADYIKIIEEKNKVSSQELGSSLNERARKLAFVIQNTPILQYQVKDLVMYDKIETQAFIYQREITIAKELDKGFGLGD